MVIVGNAKEFQPMVVGVRMTTWWRLAGLVALVKMVLVSFLILLALQVRYGIGIPVSVRVIAGVALVEQGRSVVMVVVWFRLMAVMSVAVLIGVPGNLSPIHSAMG